MAVVERKRPEAKMPKDDRNPAQMTFFEHLAELRNRLFWSALAVVVCTIVGWTQADSIIKAMEDLATPTLQEMARNGHPSSGFQFLNITDPIAANFEVSLYTGLLLASPIIVYHILAFLAPALEPESNPGDPGYDQEVKVLRTIRRSVIFFIPVVILFFVIGVAFAYYLFLPSAVKVLITFGKDQASVNIVLRQYIDTVTRVLFWTGLIFELPMFLFLLAKIRVVTWRKLAGWWKWAILVSMLLAAIVNPSPDVLTWLIFSVPIFGLFWLGVLFARFA